MKKPEGKWFASYVSPSEYELYSKKQFDAMWDRIMEDGDADKRLIEALQFMNSFKTFKEAKAYLTMHLKGDIMECKMNLKQLRSRRATDG